MNNSRAFIGIAVFVAALILAIWLGINIATEQLETLLKITGAIVLIVCALIGRRIWMIVPLMGALNLSLPLPGNPSTLLIGQVLFVGFCGLLFLSRKLHYKLVFTELEFWTLILTLCVLQTYIRNPIGLDILGGESVGARPYVLFVASLVCSVILGSFVIPAAELKWMMRLSIFGSLLNFTVQTIGFFVPQVSQTLGNSSTEGVSSEGQQRGEYGFNAATRIGFLGSAGRDISLVVSSFISPLRACFHPLWAPLILLSLALAALSGYRNQIAVVGLIYLISLAYRGGFISVFISTVALVMGVALLAVVNITTPLPANAQRALSFLPGTWNQAYVQDTQGSTDWRVDMWKEALLTDFWIQNKILGDGLGMTKQEFNYIASLSESQTVGVKGTGNLSRQQEIMMASGAYHSGPVSSIRVIGYVGLIVLLLAQIRLAVHAHRQIQRAKNSEWFPLTLFVGIPLISAPIFFVLIFGDFGAAAASLLMGIAIVRILENNLPLPKFQKNKILPSIPMAKNQTK